MATKSSNIKAGDVFQSNRFGEVVVLEYVNSKNILVQFKDCGSVQTVQSWFLQRGMVTPKGNGRLKIRNKEAFFEYWEKNKTSFEIVEGEWPDNKYRIECKKCGHNIGMSKSDVIHPMKCFGCFPIESPNFVHWEEWKERLSQQHPAIGGNDKEWDVVLPDNTTWEGVTKSKVNIVHNKCGRVVKTVGASSGISLYCVQCSREEAYNKVRLGREQIHWEGLHWMLKQCHTNFNGEYEYDISNILQQPSIYPYKSTVISYTHIPCGTVINRSLSYHLRGAKGGVGCPNCASYGYSYNNGNHLYVLFNKTMGMFKVGISKDVDQRVVQVNKGMGRAKWQLFWKSDVAYHCLRETEKQVNTLLQQNYHSPDPLAFNFDGMYESYVLDDTTTANGHIPLFLIKQIFENNKI